MRRLIPESGFGRHVALLASGTVAAQGLLILLTPVLFRLYSKEDLDALSGFSALFFSLVTVMALRYEQGVPIADGRARAVHLLRLCAVTAAILGLAIWVVLLAFGGPIAAALGQPLLAQHPWVLPVALVGGSLYLTGASWFTREQKFHITARTTVTQAIAMGIVQIGGAFVLAGQGALALALGLAIGRSAGVFSFWRGLKEAAEWSMAWSMKEMSAMRRRYQRFALFNAPSTLANNLGLQLPPILLMAMYPAGSAAAYYAAMRVLGSPMSLLGAAVGQAYQGEAARLVREAPHELLPLFNRTVKRLAKVAAVVLVAGLSAPLWLGLLLGPNAGQAGVWTAMLAPSLCLGFICSPISMTANVVERLKGQFILDMSRIAFTAAALGVPALLGWTADQAVLTYAIGSVIVYTAYLAYYRSCAAAASRAPAPATDQA